MGAREAETGALAVQRKTMFEYYISDSGSTPEKPGARVEPGARAEPGARVEPGARKEPSARERRKRSRSSGSGPLSTTGRRIKRGAFNVVTRARVGKHSCVHRESKDEAPEESFEQRAEDELRLTSLMDLLDVAPVLYTWKISGKKLAMLQQRYDSSLDDWLSSDESRGLEEVCASKILVMIARTADAGRAHLDLKPKNIVVSRDGDVRFIDWDPRYTPAFTAELAGAFGFEALRVFFGVCMAQLLRLHLIRLGALSMERALARAVRESYVATAPCLELMALEQRARCATEPWPFFYVLGLLVQGYKFKVPCARREWSERSYAAADGFLQSLDLRGGTTALFGAVYEVNFTTYPTGHRAHASRFEDEAGAPLSSRVAVFDEDADHLPRRKGGVVGVDVTESTLDDFLRDRERRRAALCHGWAGRLRPSSAARPTPFWMAPTQAGRQ